MSVLVKEPTIMTEAAGFNEETVRAASAAKNEPEWMLAFRLAAWRTFESMEWPKPTDEAWRRTRLTGFNLDKFTPFTTTSRQSARAELSDLLQTELDEMDAGLSGRFHHRHEGASP